MEETPSSTRRVIRTQTLSALESSNSINISNIPISRKTEESEKTVSKSMKKNGKQPQDRSALIDISNDSPIVGVAAGSLKTPASNITKQRGNRAKMMTPGSGSGSGEALLRGQVKTLLQKVEEEAELSKPSFEGRRFLHLQGFVVSPSGLLAPTPANTPQVSNLSNESGNNTSLDSSVTSPVTEEDLKISQVLNQIFDGKQESLESEKSLITRSLLLDFSEKSESSDSVLSYQGVGGESEEGVDKPSAADDDDSSVWSIQVDASSKDKDEEGAIEEDYEDEYGEADDDGGWVDELCLGMNKMNVNETITAKFAGKHKRFVYDSEGEIVDVVVVVCGENADFAAVSPGIMLLKGLPTPKGKHLRFPEEEQEDLTE